jgi:RNA polymerase sigma factor (sigma-70 family)
MIPADLTDSDVDLARKMARTAVRRLRADVRLRLADDVLSDAMLGLVKAAHDYDEQRGPFRPYASLRIRGEIGDGMRRIGLSVHASRRGHRLPILVGGSFLPSGDQAGNSDRDSPLPIDYGNPNLQYSVEMVIAVQQAFASLDIWSACLLPQQKQVYDLMRAGLTQRAISVQLHVHESYISQIMRAIRLRLHAERPVQLPWITEETHAGHLP